MVCNHKAFIIKTNTFSEFKQRLFRTWFDSASKNKYDCYIMFDTTYSDKWVEYVEQWKKSSLLPEENIIIYNEDTFRQIGFHVISRKDLDGTKCIDWYHGNTMLIYNMAYQEPYFYSLFQSYDRYFFIEDDVVFNGDCQCVFDIIEVNKDKGFIPAAIWNSFDGFPAFRYVRFATEWFDKKDIWKSLLQCAVYSNKSMKILFNFYINKNCLYHEIGFPSILIKNGIEYTSFFDLGLIKKGMFGVIFHNILQGFNSFSNNDTRNVFFHPIKNEENFKQLGLAMKGYK